MIPYDKPSKSESSHASPQKKTPRVGCGCTTIVMVLAASPFVFFGALFIIGLFSDDDPKIKATVAAEITIRSQLRDPSSYERVEEQVFEENGKYVVVITYRAKNGFGGYTRGSAAFEADKSGNIIRQR